MAKKEKISLPGSGGGIFRPNDAEGRGLQLHPMYVVGFSVVVVMFVLMLHLYGAGLV